MYPSIENGVSPVKMARQDGRLSMSAPSASVVAGRCGVRLHILPHTQAGQQHTVMMHSLQLNTRMVFLQVTLRTTSFRFTPRRLWRRRGRNCGTLTTPFQTFLQSDNWTFGTWRMACREQRGQGRCR